MASEHVRRYWTSPVIRETQMKTTMKCHFTLIILMKTNVGKNVGQNPPTSLAEMHSGTIAGEVNYSKMYLP